MNEKIKRFIQLINESNFVDNVPANTRIINEQKVICNELDMALDKAKAFDIIKTAFNITLDSKLRICDDLECIQTFFIEGVTLPKGMSVNEAFEVLRKVLEDKENE